jgi:2-oxo-3-hexenedioate decarboxylase
MDPAVIATELLDVLDRNALVAPITTRDPEFDLAAAYQVGAELLRRRQARGERAIGRKIGFTNRTIWPIYNVWAPIWGHVYDTTVTDATSLDLAGLLQPRIEPEIQLHFARTPPITQDESAILACVDWIACGFEIVQCPFPDWTFTAADSVAAYALHGRLVVGRRVQVADLEDVVAKLRRFTLTLSRDDQVQATGKGSDVLDSPLLAVAHLLEVAPIQSGEIVTTGTLTNAFPVEAGQTWSSTLDGLEVPGTTVTFSRSEYPRSPGRGPSRAVEELKHGQIRPRERVDDERGGGQQQ